MLGGKIWGNRYGNALHGLVYTGKILCVSRNWHVFVCFGAHANRYGKDWRDVKLEKEKRRDEIPYITD